MKHRCKGAHHGPPKKPEMKRYLVASCTNAKPDAYLWYTTDMEFYTFSVLSSWVGVHLSLAAWQRRDVYEATVV
jgi:hypothetical protein